MVAVLAAMLFLGFFLVDHWLHRHEPDAHDRVTVSASHIPLPPPGAFITSNHLIVTLTSDGRMLLAPDAFLALAAGGEERIMSGGDERRLHAGDTLYRINAGEESLEVAAPFSGRVLSAAGSAVHFLPDDMASAVRKLFIGEALSRWWVLECRRLSRFLGETATFAHSLADGGRLASGYLAHLAPAERRRFARVFLHRGGGH